MGQDPELLRRLLRAPVAIPFQTASPLTQAASEFGADGAAAGDDGTVYSLELSGDDVPSGLFAVDASAPLGKGEQIVLNQLGNVITGSAGGVAYFTLTIDPVSGEVTLELLDNLWHDDTADADDRDLGHLRKH